MDTVYSQDYPPTRETETGQVGLFNQQHGYFDYGCGRTLPYVNAFAPSYQNNQMQTNRQTCGRLSARNQLSGIVTRVTEGAVNAIVELDIGGGNTITSVITMASLNDLGIRVGSMATAIIKSSDVILMA